MKHLCLLAVLSLGHVALAEPSAAKEPPAAPEAKVAATLVQRVLLQPLASRERHQSRFSRGRLPPAERRVRILDPQPRIDARGGTFFSFAVDARHGVYPLDSEDGWRRGAITGCVYAGRGEVFVKIGDRHRPAAFLLGKNLKPVPEHICQTATREANRTR